MADRPAKATRKHTKAIPAFPVSPETTVAAPIAGGVLASSALRERLEAGEIIQNGTWEPKNIRPASYNVRIAADVMRFPKLGHPDEVYRKGTTRTRPFILNPGDVAFVTSQEEFKVPKDLAGNIGIRFGFVNRGLLVHTGLLISPGYGLDEAKRLHFLIVNLGVEPRAIAPGDQIVGVQFYPVLGIPDPGPVGDQRGLEEEYLDPNQPLGLSYIAELQGLSSTTTDLEQRVRRIEQAEGKVILFGVYVVAAAFLGVVLTQLLALVQNEKRSAEVGRGLDALHLTWPKICLLAIAVIMLFLLLRLFMKFCAWAWKRWNARTPKESG